MPIQLCCSTFTYMFDNAGKLGMSVHVRKLGDEIGFRLEYRAIKNPFQSDTFQTRESVVMWENVVIKYCPYCGFELKRLVNAQPEMYESLAEKHLQYKVHEQSS